MSKKPILTVDENDTCTKNYICTNEQLQILKSLEEVTTRKPPDQDSFRVHHKWSGHPNRATHLFLQRIVKKK